MSSFSHCRDLITRLDWLQLEVAFFQQNEKSLHYDVFQSNLMHEYILKIREKTIITIFHCGMLVIFWECYWSFEFLIKVVPSYRIVFRKCMCFQIFLDYAKYFTRRFVWFTGILHRSWKRWERLPSIWILFLSKSLSLSLWPLLLDSLTFLLVTYFHNSEHDCSLKSSHILSRVILL